MILTSKNPEFAYHLNYFACGKLDSFGELSRKHDTPYEVIRKEFYNTGVDYILNICYGEHLRQLIKGFLEVSLIKFDEDKVRIIFHRGPLDIIQHVLVVINRELSAETEYLHNDVKVRRTGVMSYELFAHLVFWCDIHNKEFDRQIYKRFNISKFLRKAQEAGNLSKCRKAKMGCVLVKDGKVKYTGRNGHPYGTRLDYKCDRINVKSGTCFEIGLCNHAEMNMIAKASKEDLDGGTVYVSAPCCTMCTKMLMQTGVRLVVFKNKNYSLSGLKLAYNLGGKTRWYGVR